MKRRWKWSRGKQTVCFLLLTGLILCLFWGFLGYPLPTGEMEFRRMERQYLVGPTRIVLHIDEQTRGQSSALWEQFVGVGEGCAVSGVVDHPGLTERQLLRRWDLEGQQGEIKLIPVTVPYTDWGEGGDPALAVCGILLWNVPEQAVRVSMTVRDGETLCEDEAAVTEGGGWLAGFQTQETNWGSDWLLEVPYELTVYDRTGAVVHTQKGTVPGDWR